MANAHPLAPPPPVQLLQIGLGYWLSRALHVVAALGVADLLRDGPQSADELATATNSHPDALYRVLRALSSVGVFAESENHVFALTPMSELLRSDVPGSLRPMMLLVSDDLHWQSFGNINQTVQTGLPAFDQIFGQPLFTYLSAHSADAERFDNAMTAYSRVAIDALIQAYDFSPFATVVDVAGGKGSLLGAVLAQAPEAHGILFELPHVIEGARFADYLPQSRVKLVAGSFFESIPGGASAYLMKNILHVWDDESARRIVDSCRRAAASSSKLLVMEAIVPGPNQPSLASIVDIAMLVLLAGRERTVEQYGDLLASAGFRLERVVPTASHIAILEAVPV
jgi:hypothetical protein